MERPDYSRITLIPALGELSTRRQWCVWKLVERKGKPTKVPFIAGEDKPLDTTDPEGWRDLKSAIDAYTEGEYDGIGFVFSKADPYTGVDLDKCVDEKGNIEPWAAEEIAKLSSYTELSPSRKGVHIICRGRLPEGSRKRKGHIEVYDQERYFTITGWHVKDTPDKIKDAGARVLEVVGRMAGARTKGSGTPKLEALVSEIESVCTSDARANPHKLAVLEENSDAFGRAWRRSIKRDHWSDSEWDLSVTNYLLAAQWPNPEIACALIEYRRIHGAPEKSRPDYIARTIIRAMQHSESLDAEERMTDPALDDLPDDDKRGAVLAAINTTLWPSGGVEIKDFVMHEADPPTFMLKTNKRDVTMSKEALLSGPQFHREMAVACMKLPRRLKQPAHDRMVDRLFEIVRTVEIGEEATDLGKTRQYVNDYLRDRQLHMPKNGQFKPEAMTEGVPVIYQSRICFQTKDFDDWLRRQRGVKITLRQLCGLLSESGFRNCRIGFTPEGGRATSRSVWECPPDVAAEHGVRE